MEVQTFDSLWKLCFVYLPHLACHLSAIRVGGGGTDGRNLKQLCFSLCICDFFKCWLIHLCTAAFGSLRPEKCPQVCINSSGKPVIQPLQEQQQGQEKSNLPPAGQDETVCTAQVGEGNLNEVHLGQTSKLQEVSEENKTETLSSKDEHLQTWALYGVNHTACTPLSAHFRIQVVDWLVCFQSRLKYCMLVIHFLETNRIVV